MAQLVFIDGRRMGASVALQPQNSVGRAVDNALVLAEEGVADRHAFIRFADGAWRIVRADPAARLAVNGKPADNQALRHGDILSIGGATLLFSDEPGSKAVTPTPEGPASTVHSRVKSFADVEASVSAVRKGRRALEHLEALHRTGAALAATLRLSDLVDPLLGEIASSLRPDRCFLLLKDERGELRVAGERVSERSRRAGSVKVSRTLLQEAMDRHEAISTRDAVDDARFAGGASVSAQRIHSAITAPLLSKQGMLGALHVDLLEEGRAFDDEDLTLLNAVAAQAALAIENVRSLEREAAQGRALARLGEASRRLSSSLSADFVCREAAAQAGAVFECSKASVLLLAGGALTVAASNCIEPAIWPQVRIRPGEGYAGRVLQDGRPLLVTDASSGRAYETPSCAIAPVVSRGEALRGEPRIVGVVSVADKLGRGPFTPLDLELLGIFAAQLGIALHNARLYERATTDSLTGLFNRQYLDVHGPEALAASPAILMLDLDHFKDKNDVYGHPVGDVILREAAALLRRRLPPGGFAARYGGEEFVALVPGLDASAARGLAEDVRREVEEHAFNAPDEPLRCTLSIGAALSRPGESLDALVKRADQALYLAKKAGRNRVEMAR
jgi:diguanylate cyclase (GGDEF)-like protein